MRYVMLDKVTELVVGERARGIKCVTLSDDVLHDHFPGYPVLPGVLVIEAAAQLAGFLLECSNPPISGETQRRAVLAQIDKAKFYAPTQPGDRIELSAKITGALDGAARVVVEASVEGESVMRGQLTFMLRLIDSEQVHAQRRDLYRIWTRGLEQEIRIP